MQNSAHHHLPAQASQPTPDVDVAGAHARHRPTSQRSLNFERRHVDLDNLVIKVLGKGHRERLVPISLECRKHLHRLLARTSGDLVFKTSSGLGITRHNAHRDIKRVCRAMGVDGPHVHPHAFRHCFAASYVRNGGDIYRLSRILGHSTITTTQLYLRSMGIEHLQENHAKLSPLSMQATR